MVSRERAWHTLPPEEAARLLGVDPAAGLGHGEARRRLAQHGPNAVEARRRPTVVGTLWRQVAEPMALVLVAAAALALVSGQRHDAVAIAAIVLLNAVLGGVQEARAERALEALRRLAAPRARVWRAGAETVIPAAEVVPGDILLLSAGDRVAADALLLEAHGLEVDESTLTGESVPAGKAPGVLADADVPVGDRPNMVFQGTAVTRGRGRALVVATGEATEVGRLVSLLRSAGAEVTPLQRELGVLGRRLLLLSLSVAAVVGLMGVIHGEERGMMLLTAVSLAVAAIPEGLPAVVTAVLALGVQRMARRGAVVRRLAAVETLGCATLIATDKTGTLTRNEMEVAALCPASERSWRRAGDSGWQGSLGRVPAGLGSLLLLTAALCGDARPAGGGPAARGALAAARLSWRRPLADEPLPGDPTEVALVRWAEAAGGDVAGWRHRFRRVAEVPFDQGRMWMGVAVAAPPDLALPGIPRAAAHLLVKGAPERVLERCSHYWASAGPMALEAAARAEFLALAERGAAEGLRVLALAWRGLREQEADQSISGLTLLGLVGLLDPPRPGAAAAVERCRRAGIEVVMLTGDHARTAEAVARQVGLVDGGAAVLTGAEMARLSGRELAEAAARTRVFARVTPEQKLELVRAFKAQGHVVAVTGDGVNDAPALKEAHIGIAMGRAGTEVAKEAADMVLADDNFATIVAAVEEGRGIYFNLQRFVAYLLACNAGEVALMLGASLVGLPVPLMPSNLLLVNLVTDGLPALALGVGPAPRGLMEAPPRERRSGILDGGQWLRVLLAGAAFGLGPLGVFALELWRTGELAAGRTAVFSSLALGQLVYAFLLQQSADPGLPLRERWAMPVALALSTGVLLAAIFVPGLQPYFHSVTLDAEGLLLSLLAAWLTARLALAAWLRSGGSAEEPPEGPKGRPSARPPVVMT